MKKNIMIALALLGVALLFVMPSQIAFAADAANAAAAEAQSEIVFGKSLGAGIAIALTGIAGAIAIGLAIAKAVDAIARQPEAESKIRSLFMLGIVFIETVVIYALIVAILIIFVL